MNAVAPHLLLLSVVLPFGALALALWPGGRFFYRYTLPWLPLPALCLGMLAPDSSLELPWLLNGGLWLVDDLRRTFLVVTALVWSVSGLFAVGYLKRVHQTRFCVFWTLTLAGNLGLIVAADIASFYSFFALMTFAGYGLVVHEGTVDANRAGRIYLTMAVAGEMAILAGLLMSAELADSARLSDLPGAIARSEQRDLIVLLLLAGFGVKAGLPLLHFWLPLAHPVALTPASAVLSGAMIKAGLLGWMLTLPFGEVSMPVWGNALVLLGVLGALGGAALGLGQRRAKAVLAYSSISQMGLVVLMVGAALAEARQAGTLLAVVALYGLHHGLAKGSLFLSTALALPERRSGRWLLWGLIALPGLSLAGLPFTSGSAAKLAMKDVLTPPDYHFAMASWLPAFMSAGAVATMLLILRFLQVQNQGAARGDNVLCLWLGWAASLLASVLLFWVLPWPESVPDKRWLHEMLAGAWGLTWPMLLAIGSAAVVACLFRQR